MAKFDFEKYWLGKFSNALLQGAGEDVRDRVMEGSDQLSSDSDHQQVIQWTQQAMKTLESLVEPETVQQIMTACACEYPTKALQEIKQKYQETKDIDLVHQLLQEKFETFLHDTVKLDEQHINTIVENGWGLAGIKQGNKISAIKIPKSGNLVEYMNTTDPDKKRQLYCHCPRIRKVLQSSERLSSTYCYCGAGFYKGIWEEILQTSVHVELVQSVLAGDDVCEIAIYLPD